MRFDRVVATMQRPDVRRSQHHRCEVIACAFIHSGFAIVFSPGATERIAAEIGGMVCKMMAEFVVKNTGVVRSVGAISIPRGLDERSIFG